MAFDIQITGLKKKFGNVLAINNLNLAVQEGEMLGLIGPMALARRQHCVFYAVCSLLMKENARLVGRMSAASYLLSASSLGICQGDFRCIQI